MFDWSVITQNLDLIGYGLLITLEYTVVTCVLGLLLSALTPGDQLIVTGLDRLGKPIGELAAFIDTLAPRDIAFTALNEAIHTAGPHGPVQLHTIRSVTAAHNNVLSECTTAGVHNARTNGKQLGRPPAVPEAQLAQGRSVQSWLTFRQAKALGGSVRKGERGSMIVYADRFIPKAEMERAASDGDEPQAVPFLKRYTVFNAEQCEGLPEDIAVTAPPVPECEQIDEAEDLIAATGADFRIGGDRAFYVPSLDFIQVPPQPAFFAEAALFPLEQYPGSIVSDLFEEDRYFDDAAQFWALQNAAIAGKREALLAEGWAEVHVLDIGERFWSWDHVPTPKEDGGHVHIETCADGTVNIHEGYLSHKASKARQTGSEGAETTAPDRPELTRAAQNYLQLHRHAAVRHALLSHPQTALRLIAAHMIAGSNLWRIDPEPQKADKLATTASVIESHAETELAKERKTVASLLGLKEVPHAVVANNTDDYRLAGLFLTLGKLSDEDVLRILTYLMAETLETASGTVEALGSHLAVDMRAYWQPDDAFFDLLRDKAAINAMLAEVGGENTANASIAEPVKGQKRIIRDFLAGTGRPKDEDWLPGYMEFPLRVYTQAGGGALQGDSERMQSLLRETPDDAL